MHLWIYLMCQQRVASLILCFKNAFVNILMALISSCFPCIVFQERTCKYSHCINNELLILNCVQECIFEYTQSNNNELLPFYIMFQECICDYKDGVNK